MPDINTAHVVYICICKQDKRPLRQLFIDSSLFTQDSIPNIFDYYIRQIPGKFVVGPTVDLITF